jgi:hypothetical protein
MVETTKRWLSIAGATCLAATACIGGNTGPEDGDPVPTGSISAATSTSGTNVDADGYVVVLDEAHSRPIDPTGFVTFSALPTGSYNVLLDGIASNCVVAASNPVNVTLLADSSVVAQFDLTCT